MLLALDTETTGTDLYHGAKPYFVTVCDEGGTVSFWQWPVDPLTRQVKIPAADVKAIADLLRVQDWSRFSPDVADRHGVVTQNGKFDAAALAAIGIRNWPWRANHDTLIASHLLASNEPHDLTSLTLNYQGLDIEPLERALHDACVAARRYARKHFPAWRIAKDGLAEMPSVKASAANRAGRGAPSDASWKADGWLPLAIARAVGEPDFPGDHPWRVVLQDYANADSAATLAVWQALRAELHRRDLWRIYLARLKLMEISHRVERNGVTLSGQRMDEQEQRFREESAALGAVCGNIAEGMGRELKLPKAGRSRSLDSFVFDDLRLPVLRTTPKGNPALDKHVLESYLLTLPPRSKQLAFVRALVRKRKLDTSLAYLEGYRRFRLPSASAISGESSDWFVLHPSLNPCGTNTLRFSSSNPNAQNVQKGSEDSLRYCFGPAPGWEWWSLDGKNLELRIPAYEAGEEEMIALFESPKEPPYYGSNHLLNFHTVYPDLWSQVEEEVGFEKVGPECKKRFEASWYQCCKNGGFAVQYGAVEKLAGDGTADRAFRRPGSHAKLKARFRRIHGPGGLNERLIAFARRHGFVETIPDRSVDPKRGYPLAVTRTEYGQILPTVPLNYHVQGTACWWMAQAMVRCQEQLEKWRDEENGFDGFITMQIHDELVFNLPARPARGNLPRVRVLQALMEKGGDDIGVPTPVSVEYHAENWAVGEEL